MGLVSCPVGVLPSGAEDEAVDPAGTGPHCDLGPVRSLPVLLAAPALHPASDQTDSGGSAAGDWTPPTLMSSILQGHVINLRVFSESAAISLEESVTLSD